MGNLFIRTALWNNIGIQTVAHPLNTLPEFAESVRSVAVKHPVLQNPPHKGSDDVNVCVGVSTRFDQVTMLINAVFESTDIVRVCFGFGDEHSRSKL